MKQAVKVNCKCKHDFQDKEYGVGVRLATVSTKEYRKETGRSTARCTVCGAQHKEVRV